MAERLKSKLLSSSSSSSSSSAIGGGHSGVSGTADLVVGPDAYRDLPSLLLRLQAGGGGGMSVQLSLDETYADVAPVRTDTSGVSAYVSVMRGCNNMCSYCIVPFTRGRERSRPFESIQAEVHSLSLAGYKEITLLGQNVNSYRYTPTVAAPGDSSQNQKEQQQQQQHSQHGLMSKGFSTIYKPPPMPSHDCADLVEAVAQVDHSMRVRFTSPHPKDFPDKLLRVIANNNNVCKSIHLPAQSGSSSVLARMRRGYSREAYLDLVRHIRDVIPGVALSSDFISGFCGEKEEDHDMTLALMREVKFDMAFMFAYSLREGTHAHRRLQDDVAEEVKQRRLREVITTFYDTAKSVNEGEIGRVHIVLVDKRSRRDSGAWAGRSDTNKRVVFDDIKMKVAQHVAKDFSTPDSAILSSNSSLVHADIGSYVAVRIDSSTGITLRGTALALLPPGAPLVYEF